MKIKLDTKSFLSKNSFTISGIMCILIVLGLASYFGWFIYNNVITSKPIDMQAIESKEIGIDEELYKSVTENLEARKANKLDIAPSSVNDPFMPEGQPITAEPEAGL